MKKLALLALAIPVLGLTMLACSDTGDPSIPEGGTATVTIAVTDNIGEWDTQGLYLRGTLTGDQDVPLTADGLEWTADVDGVATGDYAFSIYTEDGSKAEVLVSAGHEVTVNDVGGVTGDLDIDLDPRPGGGFRLVVTNNNTAAYDNIKIKGAYDEWATTERDGQSADGVTVYRNIAGGLEEGSYEWGVIHDDGTEYGVWLLPPGPNLSFAVDAGGVVTGDLTFTIESPQATINLTLNCDMNDYLSPYTAVQCRGTFNNWDSIPTNMTDDDEDGIYTVTVEVEENAQVVFKFLLDGATYEEVPPECGLDDGYGGYNRSITVGTEDTSFTAPFGGCPAGK